MTMSEPDYHITTIWCKYFVSNETKGVLHYNSMQRQYNIYRHWNNLPV